MKLIYRKSKIFAMPIYLTDFPKDERLYSYSLSLSFLMFVHRYFFKECSDFDIFFRKISASWWSRSKNFLYPHVVNLSVRQFNILFGFNFLKNGTIAKKFWNVFELHRFVLYIKNCYCIARRSFYRAHQRFQYINIFCSFLMTQIGTKF